MAKRTKKDLVMTLGTHRFDDPIHFVYQKEKLGTLSQRISLPHEAAFDIAHESGDSYRLSHASGASFIANLKSGGAKKKIRIVGCVQPISTPEPSFFKEVNLQGSGPNGEKLRSAQLGAV